MRKVRNSTTPQKHIKITLSVQYIVNLFLDSPILFYYNLQEPLTFTDKYATTKAAMSLSI